MGGRKWTECLPVCVTVFSALCVLTTRAQGGCSNSPCPATSYCFDGTATICVACNKACSSCKGPGADECLKCKTGYYKVLDTCTACPSGSHGENCNDTCHCLGVNECDPITGNCQGKCEKGYWTPPACKTECPDLKYGLDCLQDCHCINDSMCDKVLGFCPNNICHPDWTSAGCNKRLPKLANPPEIIVSTCQYIIVRWSAWNAQTDFGDLPISEYRLYISNGSDLNTTWRSIANVTHSENVTSYNFNASGLLPDANYRFRVDVHYSDDGKTVEKTSLGLPSDLAHTTCTTSTSPVPVTVPVIIGADIFDAMAYSEVNRSIVVTWSLDPKLRVYSWNITLSYQKIGIGDCLSVNYSITQLAINQSESSYRFNNPDPWSKYRFTLSAKGNGIISAINGTEVLDASSYEIVPTGVISNISVNVTSTTATLRWTDVPCAERGGSLLKYDVKIWPKNSSESVKMLESITTSIVVTELTPFTTYLASIRYVTKAGPGNYSVDYPFTTLEGAPGAVKIVSLVPSVTSIVVTFNPPFPTNGVIREYDVMYSDTASFSAATSVTYNASDPSLQPPEIKTEIKRLSPNTLYYVKVRASTSARYGPYGNVSSVRTLLVQPYPPVSVNKTLQNTSCIGVTWSQPTQSNVSVSGCTVVVRKRSNNITTGPALQLAANVSQYTYCGLEMGTAYVISIVPRWEEGSGVPVEVVAYTEQGEPPQPPAPVLENRSTTSAAIVLEPVTLTTGPLTAYQIRVNNVPTDTAGRRRKRQSDLPGYTTAELSPSNVTERYIFLVGDDRVYGGFRNVPLLPGQQYDVYYVVLSTVSSTENTPLTKYSSAKMNTTLVTLTSLPTTLPTSIAATTAWIALLPDSSNSNDVLIGIIVALILLALIIIIVVLIICWRRRQRNLLIPPPYLELNEEVKSKPGKPKSEYKPEKFWNQITLLREKRYIVAGRECLPGDRFITSGSENLPLNDSAINFRKEFHSLPHKLEKASNREAERHPGLNRFPHILPYDHNRVELPLDIHITSTYINASYISGYKRSRAYIAAQSPFDDRTVVDFWRMIHHLSIKTVVMVTNVVEDNVVKCTAYWPKAGKVSKDSFFLELLDEQVLADYTVRIVSVQKGQEKHVRIVRLYEFTSWPEHGVPDDPIPFLDMRYKIREYHGDEPGPILVHCGSGIARTGVFIAVDTLIQQYAAEGRISVFSFVRKMRKERPLMVRTYKQYAFIYESIFEEFQAGDTMVEATTLQPMYQKWQRNNIKTGRPYLQDQFNLLQRFTIGPEAAQCVAASLPLNVHKNRYPDVLPSDIHRPNLTTNAKIFQTDYINAIFVDGFRKRNQFIVTQTPLHTTIVDFWRLVYDYNVQTIVMLDNYQDEDDTLAEYWPSDVSRKLWEPFFVEITATYEQDEVTIRNFKLRNTLEPKEQARLVRQFRFTSWTETSFTPVSKKKMMDLFELVRQHQNKSSSPDSPIVVHCEDGATYSGLFVTMLLVLERLEEVGKVDVYHVIKHVKRRRTQILDDYDQFRLCYQVLWNFITMHTLGWTFSETEMQNNDFEFDRVNQLEITI